MTESLNSMVVFPLGSIMMIHNFYIEYVMDTASALPISLQIPFCFVMFLFRLFYLIDYKGSSLYCL